MTFKNQSVSSHQFAMIPRADIPRSSFKIQTSHKTTFDAGLLIPVYVEEILPGDSYALKMTAFARMATPIYPVMDNLYLESFFFFVPCRLLWDNWQKFMGQQTNPGDSIDFTIPQIVSPADGYNEFSTYDYMGLPIKGQIAVGETITHSALPLRAYALIFNQWFRDENLVSSIALSTGNGPDTYTTYVNPQRRGKRHDYFTSCLPWTQKGNSVTLPLGTSAPVIPTGTGVPTFKKTGTFTGREFYFGETGGSNAISFNPVSTENKVGPVEWDSTRLIADLSTATAATINQIRQSFQIQKLLERDARGGTRYTEIVRSHFGVVSPDARLQRAEYLGGGSSPINFHTVPQTSATTTESPLAGLSAYATAVAKEHGFRASFTEHGYVIGLVNVRADLSYQQGLRKLWSRSTRYDFYFPVFAALGEQAVLNQEIYCTGVDASDSGVFGYQERWAEYRYHPAQITGAFRSTYALTLDAWHLAQNFTSLPTLNSTFIRDTPPLARVIAVDSELGGQQFLFDSFFDIRAARCMPLYSVPGLVDHF